MRTKKRGCHFLPTSQLLYISAGTHRGVLLNNDFLAHRQPCGVSPVPWAGPSAKAFPPSSMTRRAQFGIHNSKLFAVQIENTRIPLVFLKRKSKNRDPPFGHVLPCFWNKKRQ
jgi:hypothetical protein